MSEEEINDPEELKKEIAFFKSQTRVLREKNRDLRNALLLSEAQQGTPGTQEETTQESLSDIRKIIADSKQQITEKLSKFKETMNDSETTGLKSEAPVVETKTTSAVSVDSDILVNQVEYMKLEIDRLENFLEQSEMVNDRLRMLLTEHNIDVSEISKAISQASKTAIKETPVAEPVIKPEVKKSDVVLEPVIKEAPKTSTSKPEVTTPKSKKKALDPAVAKLFDNFKVQIETFTDEKVTMEILDLREELMDLIPHTRVFYEMQIEYRKWKKGISSRDKLKKEITKWEETIATM
ncbi:MAG: hypothetical protein ACTSXA_00800 [Candidatus Heimdallarchaeota archaeon]